MADQSDTRSSAPPPSDADSTDAFGASFQAFMTKMATQEPADEPVFLRTLREHFGGDPRQLAIVSEAFPASDLPSFQRALDSWLAAADLRVETLGFSNGNGFGGASLNQLIAASGPGLLGSGPSIAPVRFKNFQLLDATSLQCIESGLLLVGSQGARLAVLIGDASQFRFQSESEFVLEVMASDQESAAAFLRAMRQGIRRHNVYKGHAVGLNVKNHSLDVSFFDLPAVQRDDIILPAGLLERIERQTLGFSEHIEALRRARRHLRRGLLLHGPPGTGKTLTVMYLATRMQGRTTIVLTGRKQGLLERACQMARQLEPATVILEDVDLVAEERGNKSGCEGLLVELLNQMDGLGEDADVLFLLTTNRPEVLEPALASRPGRVDQAIEVPLPDDAGRRRLIELYAEGLQLTVDDIEPYVRRTQGVSAAFIRELMRRAALLAAEKKGEAIVGATDLDGALEELTLTGGELTRRLLGFQAEG